jgi:hypothetical protein
MALAVAPARAETPAPQADESFYELRRRAEKANKEGDPEEAMRLLRAAWELRKSYFDICTLAAMQLKSKQWRGAAESFALCKKALPDVDRIQKEESIERMAKQARDHIGTITVTANVPGAEVLLDNKIIGKIPLEVPILVDPGWYAVEVRAPGRTSAGMVFQMGAGVSETWDAQLEPLKLDRAPRAQEPPPPAPKPPAAPPTSAPTASPPRAASPPDASNLPEFRWNSQVGTENETGPFLVAGMSIGAVGLGLASASFVAALMAQNQASDLTDNLGAYDFSCSSPTAPSACKDIAELGGQSKAFMMVGLGGLAICATGLALVTYDIYKSSSPKKKASAQGALVVVPGGGALRVDVAF